LSEDIHNVRCVILIGNPEIRAQFRAGLEECGIEVVGEADDLDSGGELVASLHPDTALVLQQLTEVDALDPLRTAIVDYPNTTFVLLSTHVSQASLATIASIGIRSVVALGSEIDTVAYALLESANGRGYIDPAACEEGH
jgi:DNA-binding NarL/FixJ family response regulator